MSIAHSDATSLVQMGSFTGSVKAMCESPDFLHSFKKFFELKSIGFWWAFPKSEVSWTKDSRKWSMFYEIDRSDVDEGRNEKILSYFHKHSCSVDDNFFGTPMSISPMYTHFLNDEEKMRITKMAKK